MKVLVSLSVLGGLLFAATSQDTAPKHDWRELDCGDGTTLRYVVHTPPGFEAGETHPFLIAFPPGDQSAQMTEWIVDYFSAEADRLGWAIVAPQAIDGVSYFGGSEKHIPTLLESLQDEFAVEWSLFHAAGVSNGGRSGFRVLGKFPENFVSLNVLPGMPAADEDFDRLQHLAHLPVSMWVGQNDQGWVEGAQRTKQELDDMGAVFASLEVVEGAGHVLDESIAKAAFERLERIRQEVDRREEARATIGDVLDGFHDAAAKADEDRYFGYFAPGAVFIGTDATERWSLAEFKRYAWPHFQKETAWTFVPFERHLSFSRDATTAWFDEKLRNEKYGETRGSGVLIKRGERWWISHYVLSFPIPNDLAPDVVEKIRSSGR